MLFNHFFKTKLIDEKYLKKCTEEINAYKEVTQREQITRLSEADLKKYETMLHNFKYFEIYESYFFTVYVWMIIVCLLLGMLVGNRLSYWNSGMISVGNTIVGGLLGLFFGIIAVGIDWFMMYINLGEGCEFFYDTREEIRRLIKFK